MVRVQSIGFWDSAFWGLGSLVFRFRVFQLQGFKVEGRVFGSWGLRF